MIQSIALILAVAGGMFSGMVNEDLDTFIEKVIENRAATWQRLYDYVFKENERFSLTGTLDLPDIMRYEGEFSWYVKDGYLVRSPVSLNGAEVPAGERQAAEEKWIKRQEKRSKDTRFADRDEFFGFNFKKGTWLLKGTREIDGIGKVVIAEFYPDLEAMGGKASDKEDEEFRESFRRTTTVTLEVLPESHQIVTMTLHNSGLDYLPMRWLMHVSGVKAQLVMRPIADGLWAPAEITAGGRISTADGDLDVSYRTEYRDYSRTAVRVKFRFEPISKEESEKNDENEEEHER